MSNRERIAVSSATFIDLSNPLPYGIKTVEKLAERSIYAPEMREALKTAKELDLGLELVYRIGLRNVIDQARNCEVPVMQVHGPVVWNLSGAVSEAQEIKGKAIAAGMALFANGTLASNWQETKEIAQELNAKSIVLHPNGAEIYYKNRGMLINPDEQLVVGIEPDFRRMEEKQGIVWNPNEVIRIAKVTRQGVCFDTSHTGITYNSVNDMFTLYERYKREAPKGVVAIHFSVAIPGENRKDFFTKGTGARPLYQDTPDKVKGAYREFYQHVMKDETFKGPFVLEMWSFPKDNSMEGRKNGIEETLNVLEGSNTPPRIYSFK